MKDTILKIISSCPNHKASLSEIESKLDSKVGIKKAIDELVKEGSIYKSEGNEYIVTSFYHLVPARIVSASRKRLIALSTLDNDSKYYIESRYSGEAIFDDIVLVGFNRDNCYIKSIINPSTKLVVGIIEKGDNSYYINPFNKELPLVNIDNGNEGDIVAAKIISRFPLLMGQIVEILGSNLDGDTRVKALALSENIDLSFNDDVKEEAKSLLDYNLEEEYKNRVDHSNDLIVTIDGINTKDFDDAISVSKTNNIYNLKVHIADVSYFVNKYTNIDKEALKRGCSIYLVNQVLPMLPFELSDNLCSLMPNTKKLTMTCSMDIDLDGNVINYDIYESYIVSKYRLTYDEVNEYYDNGKRYEDNNLNNMLDIALELSKILKKNKQNRGEIELNIEEPKLILKDNLVIDVIKGIDGKAESLIEDFMVVANETVASHIYYQDLPFIYRVHDKPSSKKLIEYSNLINDLGYSFPINKEIYPSMFQSFLNSFNNNPLYDVIKIYTLRAMSKAIYSNNNIGHFGLASKCYTHFTSPIRRYPDLLVHRLLKMYMHNEKYNINQLENEIKMIADLSSINEQRAIDLERKAMDIKIAEYLSTKIGTTYNATVSGFSNTLLFVELDNKIEGHVKLDSIKDDIYEYEKENNQVIGIKYKKSYKIGDKVVVKLHKANIKKGYINFIVI